MTDRVKYFLLGLLFLVVAGVIAFDRWNSREALSGHTDSAYGDTAREDTNSGETWVNPPTDDPDGPTLIIDPDGPKLPVRDGPNVALDPKPGPVVNPKPVDPKPIPAARADKTHVVKSGETLEAISRQYYPGKVHAGIKLIARANKIENLNRIRERQELVIPAMNSRSTRKPTVNPVDKSKKVPATYTVKAGDGDLYSICKRYYGQAGQGPRIREIMELNGMWSSSVTAGTVLKLPPR